MTRKVFLKLLGLFLLLLVFQTVAMEVILRHFMEHLAPDVLRRLVGEAMWAGLLSLLVALPLAAWAALGIAGRLQQVVEFARRIAQGDLGARLNLGGADELSAMETALNQTAGRLEQNFAEIESRRHELATMLDSMQEAVVAVSAEGVVLWSNAVMQRIAGTQIRVGRALVHSVRDPELLGCVKAALESGEVRFGRSGSLAPGRTFEINAAPLPSGGALAVLHDVSRIEAA
ncbi:MAG TPA: HAMP domain-containing protein, partial [Terracidiphilus sp.]|nr:HAMP domain-containing protein [Terracidiphilus sp.]